MKPLFRHRPDCRLCHSRTVDKVVPLAPIPLATPNVGRVADGEQVRVTSRRGSIVVPVRIDPGLRSGLVFTTFHFNDAVATNLLTIDATDRKSGTAEFKACAVRIEKVA